MRAVGQKGLGDGTQMSWLIRDLHEELKSWGYPGGADNKLIFKSDGEPAIKVVREALARYHGGEITPEQPPVGEKESNGAVEQAGQVIRGIVKTLKDQIEFNTGGKLDPEDSIMQWMIRWAAMLYNRFRLDED